MSGRITDCFCEKAVCQILIAENLLLNVGFEIETEDLYMVASNLQLIFSQTGRYAFNGSFLADPSETLNTAL